MSKPSIKDKYLGIMRNRAIELFRAKAELDHCFPDGQVRANNIAEAVIEAAHYQSHAVEIERYDWKLAATAQNAEELWGTDTAKLMYDDAIAYAEKFEFVVTDHDSQEEPKEARIPTEYIPKGRYQA